MGIFTEFFCGKGIVIDWQAVSAIATLCAVIVALWIPIRDRRERKLERLEAESKAAKIVKYPILAILDVFPSVIAAVRETNGRLIDVPGAEILYGIELSRELIEREPYCRQLPIKHVDNAELVVSIARKWCREIETRQRIEQIPELVKKIGHGNPEYLCALGETLLIETEKLRESCLEVESRFTRTTRTWRRVFDRCLFLRAYLAKKPR